jgi:hypothetical protein
VNLDTGAMPAREAVHGERVAVIPSSGCYNRHSFASHIVMRVKELTSRSRCHADLGEVIADINPVLRGGDSTSVRVCGKSARTV